MSNDLQFSPFTANVFRRAELPPIRAVTKSTLSPDMAAWARAEDVDAGGNGAKLVSPYSQSAWVYIAVSILAQNVAQIPFRISRVGGGAARRIRSLRGSHQPTHRNLVRKALNADILESGDVVDLFKQPHPTMNGELFWEMVVTWAALRGEFFILPLDASDAAGGSEATATPASNG